MFYRYSFKKLQEWASQSIHKPLVLRGARQVGKTTLVLNFSKEFDQFIHLNLEKPLHKKLFNEDADFNEIVNAIFFTFNKKRNIKSKTLIFIDEIQNSSEAIKLLRYFHEETPDLYVIAAGSLLETLLNSGISFPVGRVEYLAIRPCSFLEFLEANGETNAIELINEAQFPKYAHEKLMDLFQKFCVVGGMPEIVQNYANNKDVINLKKTYQTLLTGYTDDVEKYALNYTMIQHIRHIIKAGFSYAGEKIKFEKFANSDYRSREMAEAFRTLEKTMLLELIYPSNSKEIPLLANYSKTPRLQWLDTGLVNFAAGVQKEIFMAKDIHSAWKGKIAEHIVGQELIAYNSDVMYRRNFWTREEKNATAEIDYLYQYGQHLLPIEVKSGEKGTLKSLHLFMNDAPHSIALRISSLPYSIDKISLNNKTYTLINLPLYGISQLEKVIDGIIFSTLD